MKLKECRHGFMLYNPLDQFVGRSLELYGEFSRGEWEMFDAIVHPGHVVLDVGANIGAHTIPFGKRAAHVIAFEPQRLVYQTLTANVALNELHNVVTIHAAVGSAPGQVYLPVLDPDQEQNFGGFSVELGAVEKGKGEPVPVIPIDAFGFGRVDFIKMDVEGMELEALQGAERLIKRDRPVLYVEDDRTDRSKPLRDYISGELDYEIQEHSPPLFSDHNFAGNPENVFEGIVSINIVCYPREYADDAPHATA